MTDLPQKVAKLEVRADQIDKDIAEIKTQVTNHIPTQIAEVKKVVDGLEKAHIGDTAVAKSWDNNLKKTLIGIGIVFTVLRIAEFFIK